MSTSRFQFDAPRSSDEFGLESAPAPIPESGGWFARAAYVAAALLLLGALLAAFNPEFGFHNELIGFDAHLWPWELFQSEHGVAWTRETAWVLVMAGAALVLLVCAFLRPGRTRARLALATAALVAASLLPNPNDSDLLPGCGLNLLLGVLMAACVGASMSPRWSSSLRLAAMATFAVAVLLFLPMPPLLDELGDTSDEYRSIGQGGIDALANALGPNPHVVGRGPEGDIHATVGNVARVFVHEISWLLGLLVGLLTTVGLGRGWARFAMGLVLLLAIVGPPAVFAWRTVDEERLRAGPDRPFATRDAALHAARGAGETLLRLERLALLPLALGLADLLRNARRRP